MDSESTDNEAKMMTAKICKKACEHGEETNGSGMIEVKREPAEFDVYDGGSMPSLLLMQQYSQGLDDGTVKIESDETCSDHQDAENIQETDEYDSFVYLPAPEAMYKHEQSASDQNNLQNVYGEGATFVKQLRLLEQTESLDNANTKVQPSVPENEEWMHDASDASAEYAKVVALSTPEAVPVKLEMALTGSVSSPHMADETDEDTGTAVEDVYYGGNSSTPGSHTEGQVSEDPHDSKDLDGMVMCKDCHVSFEYDLLFRHMFEDHQHCLLVPHRYSVFHSQTIWAVALSPTAPSVRHCQFCLNKFDRHRLLKHMISIHDFLLRCPYVTDCQYTCPNLPSIFTHLVKAHNRSYEMASEFAEMLEGSKDNVQQQPEATMTTSGEDWTNAEDSSAQDKLIGDANRTASGPKSEAAAIRPDKNCPARKTPKAIKFTLLETDQCSTVEGREERERLPQASKRGRQLAAQEQKRAKKRRVHVSEALDLTASNRTPEADKHKADSKINPHIKTERGTEADHCSTAERRERPSRTVKRGRQLAAQEQKIVKKRRSHVPEALDPTASNRTPEEDKHKADDKIKPHTKTEHGTEEADHCSTAERRERPSRTVKRGRQLAAQEQKIVKKRSHVPEALDPTASNRTPKADKHKADDKIKPHTKSEHGTEEADHCSTAERRERPSRTTKRGRQLAAQEQKRAKKRRACVHEASCTTPDRECGKNLEINNSLGNLTGTSVNDVTKSWTPQDMVSKSSLERMTDGEPISDSRLGTDKDERLRAVGCSLYEVNTDKPTAGDTSSIKNELEDYLHEGGSESTERLSTSISKCPKCNLFFVMSKDSVKQHLSTSHDHLIPDKQCSQSQSREVAVPDNFPKSSPSVKCTDGPHVLTIGARFLYHTYHMLKQCGYHFVCPYSTCGLTFQSGMLQDFQEHLKVVHGIGKGKSTCGTMNDEQKTSDTEQDAELEAHSFEELIKIDPHTDSDTNKHTTESISTQAGKRIRVKGKGKSTHGIRRGRQKISDSAGAVRQTTDTEQDAELEAHSSEDQIKIVPHTDKPTAASIHVQLGGNNNTLCPHCHMVLESHTEFMKHMSFSHIYLFLCPRNRRAMGPCANTLLAVAMSAGLKKCPRKCVVCSDVLDNGTQFVVHLTELHEFDIMCPYSDNFYSFSVKMFIEHFCQAHKVKTNTFLVWK